MNSKYVTMTKIMTPKEALTALIKYEASMLPERLRKGHEMTATFLDDDSVEITLSPKLDKN